MLDKELLKKLSEFAKKNNLDIDGYTRLLEIAKSKIDTIKSLKRSISKIKEEYKERIGDIESDIVYQQSHCSHEVKEHYCDPAGGSDSFDECQICGKQF